MKFAFITGMGRSGTKFLSQLLSLNENVHSYHEYFGGREYWLASWYIGKSYSKNYLFAKKNSLNNEKILFIDTNSYLNSDVEVLNDVFNNPMIFHLVRNPKKVVPSLMTRRNDDLMHKIPKKDFMIKQWISMNKLEQVCLNWTETTEYLLESNTKTLKFESLCNDCKYVEEELLKPLGIKIPEEKIKEFQQQKINKTRSQFYRYLYSKIKGKKFMKKTYSFDNFTAKEIETFYEICGKTMTKLGYK